MTSLCPELNLMYWFTLFRTTSDLASTKTYECQERPKCHVSSAMPRNQWDSTVCIKLQFFNIAAWTYHACQTASSVSTSQTHACMSNWTKQLMWLCFNVIRILRWTTYSLTVCSSNCMLAVLLSMILLFIFTLIESIHTLSATQHEIFFSL